jgi:hypothetical protein
MTFVPLNNHMKKETFKTLVTCGFFVFLGAHAIAQSVFNCANNEVEINSNVFEHSIGEMVLVSTVDAGATRLTQGFLQPIEGIIINVESIVAGGMNLSVYPNPFNGLLNLRVQGAMDGVWTVELLDTSGRLVWSAQRYFTYDTMESIDLTDAAAGCYFLKLSSKEHIQTPFETIRVIKY